MKQVIATLVGVAMLLVVGASALANERDNGVNAAVCDFFNIVLNIHDAPTAAAWYSEYDEAEHDYDATAACLPHDPTSVNGNADPLYEGYGSTEWQDGYNWGITALLNAVGVNIG